MANEWQKIADRMGDASGKKRVQVVGWKLMAKKN